MQVETDGNDVDGSHQPVGRDEASNTVCWYARCIIIVTSFVDVPLPFLIYRWRPMVMRLMMGVFMICFLKFVHGFPSLKLLCS